MTTEQTLDPNLWLEDVAGEAALAWVRERNAETRAVLAAEPAFEARRQQILQVLDSPAKIPHVTRRGDALYNFWQDAEHPRGLWRRTTLAEYRQDKPAWQTLIDVDALGRAEGVNWVWGGASCLGPTYRHCLIELSRGGADATVLREFDLETGRFVADGFSLPEAKGSASWLSRDELLLGTDFGPGSLTDSGYPRVIKRWRRGTPLSEAVTVFEGQATDVAVAAHVDDTPGFERVLVQRAIDFYRSQQFLLQGERLLPLAKPDDAELSFWREHALLQLRSDWAQEGQVWPAGSLLVADAQALIQGRPVFQALFTPSATVSLESFTATRSRLVLNLLDQVASRLEEWTPPAAEGAGHAAAKAESAAATANTTPGWQGRAVAVPGLGSLSVQALHDPLVADDALAEHLLISYTDFLTPESLWLGRTGDDARETLKSNPRHFDSDGLRVEQRFARSADGTRVPYFVVWPRGAQADGNRPTLLYGYGGFEVSLTPSYSGGRGRAWLAQGGVFVLANLRGGGEFGPAWHQAAIKQHKQRSYDDLAAVAEDLLRSGVTRPARLGIMGGSNGGLLVGAVMLQRPELFGAVVCQVPLLDMQRYHRLLAGASWMAEYGDPDQPADWAHIARYSPYQVLQGQRPGQALPPVLFTTSTRDDRVHPGHARKMAAQMRAMGHAPLYYENIEGGHGGAADNAQRADMSALEYGFLWRTLGGAAQPD